MHFETYYSACTESKRAGTRVSSTNFVLLSCKGLSMKTDMPKEKEKMEAIQNTTSKKLNSHLLFFNGSDFFRKKLQLISSIR